METEQTQPRKSYTTADVIARFAQQGVAIDTMSRALMVGPDQVRGVCERAREIGHIVGMPPESNETAADRKLALRMEVANLREKLIDAQSLIRELREPNVMNGNVFAYDRLVHLTAHEMMILNALVAHGQVSKERLYHELYGMRNSDEQPEPKIVDVFICKLRRKLRPFGVEIVTRWGHGYEMLPGMVTRLNELAGVASIAIASGLPRVESPSLQASLSEMVA